MSEEDPPVAASRRRLPIAVASVPDVGVALPEGLSLGGGWRVSRVTVKPGRVSVLVARGEDERVEMVVSPPEGDGSSGPFDVDGLRVCYQRTTAPYGTFRDAGASLGARLREAGGLEAVRAWVALSPRPPAPSPAPSPSPSPSSGRPARTAVDSRPWRERARAALVDRRRAGLRLDAFLDDASLPPWPCVEPWTRLEFSTSRHAGPCCVDYQMDPRPLVEGTPLGELWGGPVMRGFRRAMVSGALGAHCCPSCPVLAGAAQVPGRIELRGGPEAFVEAQLDLVDEILRGAESPSRGPLVVCFPTTTWCNYDCLMCDFGETGTLADELPPSFYASLRGWAPGLQRIEVLGGEPLASPVFREYLATEDFTAYPGLEIAMTTNGSYLTPRELPRILRAPIANLVISLNAATADTYAAVNRGLPYARVRTNLDHLLANWREGAGSLNAIAYSMVVLKRNVHEVRAFADLARADGVAYRYMLPMMDRNGQSIMTDRGALEAALEALEDVLREEAVRPALTDTRHLLGEVQVLRQRLERGVYRALPDRDG